MASLDRFTNISKPVAEAGMSPNCLLKYCRDLAGAIFAHDPILDSVSHSAVSTNSDLFTVLSSIKRPEQWASVPLARVSWMYDVVVRIRTEHALWSAPGGGASCADHFDGFTYRSRAQAQGRFTDARNGKEEKALVVDVVNTLTSILGQWKNHLRG